MADQVFVIVVDHAPVDKLLLALEASIGTTSLNAFMVGKVHPWWVQAETERFAHEGDVGTGSGLFGGWAELRPATQRIRESLGYEGEAPINVRDGDLFNALITNYDITPVADGAAITIPGNVDPITEEKIRTAQHGKAGNALGLGPTPPRPVLNITEQNVVEVLALLNVHIYEQLAGQLL